MKPNDPGPAPESDPIRAALLREFYSQHGRKFEDIWKLVKGGTDRSLVGALSRDDLAFRLDEIVTPARQRYDATAFKNHLKEMTSYGAPVPSAESYFDAARQGIQAARVAADNLHIFVTSMLALNPRDIQQVMELVEILAMKLRVDISENGFTEFLDSIRKTALVVEACYAAMILATGQIVKKRGKGRPPSIYASLAIDFGELWEEVTGKPVATPKSQKKSNNESRHESSQISTQFVWLAMQMAVPNIKLQQAETAIRNAVPALRLRSKLTDPEKKAALWLKYAYIRSKYEVFL
jgi:hypothetical protein